MRLFILLLSFLYTIFFVFLSKELRERNFYLGLDFESSQRAVKNFTLNVERVLGRNVYLHLKEIRFEEGVKIKGGRLILINLERKTKKKPVS